MFGGASTTQPQHSQPHLNPPPAADLPTAEEEALKKNTDCVYFLASPLTCKKGSECEYRHSDIARLNPRDCWYWLNGSCLNPKCAFRHPPLDGLLGIQPPTPLGLGPIPPPQAATTPVAHANNSGKQGVPCVFFQKGYCLKGDRCPFLHAPPFPTNKVGSTLPAANPTPVSEPPAVNKSSAFNEKPMQIQKVSQGNAPKPVELPSQPKLAVRFHTNFSSINGVPDKYGPPSILSDEHLRYRPTNVAPTTQGDSVKRSNNITPNGKDMDEFSREPSPGFDVLVDDDLRESDYYPNEDQFGRTRGGHVGRNMNALNDYEIGSSADYNSIVDGDRDMYHDHPHGYESYERLQGQYGWEEHRLSSERLAGDPPHLESRRHHTRADSPDRVEESDLRNLLAKQRRGNNGLRSGVSRDHPRDNRGEDRHYRSARRENLQENSVSSRLRGRIKLPGRSTSPINDNYLHSDREMERGRTKVRYSPERLPMTSHQGRLRDRIKGRVQDDFNNDGRSLLGSRMRRDVITDNGTEFNGPKRLSVLKVGKNNSSDSSDQSMIDRSTIGKRKFPQLQSDTSVSFEGPKPLSEILKRKRGSEVGIPVPKESKENLMRSTVTAALSGNTGIADQEFASEKVKADVGQSSVQHNVSDEEGMINDGGTEEYDQREGGEYEDEEEEYNVQGGDNENAAELEEDEYLEEEDEGDDADDFAKKMGVMYS